MLWTGNLFKAVALKRFLTGGGYTLKTALNELTVGSI
jgi:hypothetical protein